MASRCTFATTLSTAAIVFAVLLLTAVGVLVSAADDDTVLDTMLAAKWSVTRKGCGATGTLRNGTWHIQQQKEAAVLANGTVEEIDESDGAVAFSCGLVMSKEEDGTVTVAVCGGVAAPEPEEHALTFTFAGASGSFATYDAQAKIGSARGVAQRPQQEKLDVTITSVTSGHVIVRIHNACNDKSCSANKKPQTNTKASKKRQQQRGGSGNEECGGDEVIHMYRVDEEADTLWGFWTRHGFLLMFAMGMLYFKVYTGYKKMNKKVQLDNFKEELKKHKKE